MGTIKKIMFTVGLFALCFVKAEAPKSLSFVDDKFSDFLNRIVVEDDREIFASYYISLSEDVSKKDEAKIKRTYNYLFEKALSALERDQKEWFKEMRVFLEDPKQDESTLKEAQLFLRRYGAYQEFVDIKNIEIERQKTPIGVFATVGNFFSRVGQTVSGWFGFGATKQA